MGEPAIVTLPGAVFAASLSQRKLRLLSPGTTRGSVDPDEGTSTRFAYAAPARRSRPPLRASPWQTFCVQPCRSKICDWIAAKVLSNASPPSHAAPPGSGTLGGGTLGAPAGGGPEESPPHAARVNVKLSVATPRSRLALETRIWRVLSAEHRSRQDPPPMHAEDRCGPSTGRPGRFTPPAR